MNKYSPILPIYETSRKLTLPRLLKQWHPLLTFSFLSHHFPFSFFIFISLLIHINNFFVLYKLTFPIFKTMKYSLKAINPKQLFHLKSKDKKPKSPDSLSKSSPPSFGSTTSSTSSTSSSSSSGSQHSALGLDDPARCAEDQVKVPGSDPTMEFHFDVGQAFKMIDRDGDGKITRGEMESLFKRVVGTTDEELAEMIKEIDRDGDGCISLEELTAVGFVFESTAAKGVPEEELRGAFDFFDGDHDGKISAEELFQGFIALGDERCTLEECRRMIESVDVNKDGFVCFEDFSRMMDVIPR